LHVDLAFAALPGRQGVGVSGKIQGVIRADFKRFCEREIGEICRDDFRSSGAACYEDRQQADRAAA
jgi:hypothetical protein